jgi:hypothetical protein
MLGQNDFLFDGWEGADDDDFLGMQCEQQVGSSNLQPEVETEPLWIPCDHRVPFTIGLRVPTAEVESKSSLAQRLSRRPSESPPDGPKATITYVSPCRRYFVGVVHATRYESLRALLEELLKRWTMQELKPVPRPIEPMLRNPARWLVVQHSGRWDTLLGAITGGRVATGGSAFPQLGGFPFLQPSGIATGTVPTVRQLTLPITVHYVGTPSIRATLVKVDRQADGARLNCLFEVVDVDSSGNPNTEAKQQLAAEPLVRWMKAKVIQTIGQPMHLFFDTKKRLKPLDKLVIDLPGDGIETGPDPVEIQSLSLAQAFSGGWFDLVLAGAESKPNSTLRSPPGSRKRPRGGNSNPELLATHYLGGIPYALPSPR